MQVRKQFHGSVPAGMRIVVMVDLIGDGAMLDQASQCGLIWKMQLLTFIGRHLISRRIGRVRQPCS